MTVLSDQTIINSMDSIADTTTAWTPATFGSFQFNEQNSQIPIFREGGACAEAQLDPDNGSWTDGVNVNISNGIRGDKLCGCWLFNTAPAAVNGMTNLYVGVSDAGNFGGDGGLWDFKQTIQDADTYGWYPCLFYPTQPDATVGTFANMNKAAILSFRIAVNNSAGLEVRLFGAEQSFAISYIGAHSQTVTLDQIAAHSADKTNNRDMGVFVKRGDSYRSVVVVALGSASATAPVTFNQDSKVIHFDNWNTDHDIGFEFLANNGQNVNFTLTNSFLFWNTNDNSEVFGGVANVNAAGTWVVNGNTFLRGGSVTIPANQTGFETKNNVFNNCGQINPQTGVFQGNTISNYGGTLGALKLPSNATNMPGNTFISAGTGHAIYIDTPGTYTLSGHTFSGYASANGTTGNEVIYNNSGGAVTINVSDCTGFISVRNGTGASTTVNNNVAVNISGHPVGASVVIHDDDSADPQNKGTELQRFDNAAASVQYLGSAGNAIWISMIEPGYKAYERRYTIPGTNSDFTIDAIQETN